MDFDIPTMQASLRTIPDLDVDRGLHNTSGDMTFYVSMLTKFIAGQADAVARICRSLNTGDVAGAERVAHTLKSVASNLGMQGLASRAEELEQMVSAHATPEARIRLITQTQELLDAMIASLDATLGMRTTTQSPVVATALAPEEPAAPYAKSGAIKDAV
jgi:two-component system sensor histidine kinase/response regulator